MRHFRVTTVAMEKQYVLNIMRVCLYSCLGYPACTPYPYSTVIRHLHPVWPYHIFPHYLINGMTFGEKKNS